MLMRPEQALLSQLMGGDLPLSSALQIFGDITDPSALRRAARTIHLFVITNVAILRDTQLEPARRIPLWLSHELFENPTAWVGTPTCDCYLLQSTEEGRSIWQHNRAAFFKRIAPYVDSEEWLNSK